MRILPLCMHRPTKATRRIYLPHSIKFIEKSNNAKYVINIFFSSRYKSEIGFAGNIPLSAMRRAEAPISMAPPPINTEGGEPNQF